MLLCSSEIYPWNGFFKIISLIYVLVLYIILYTLIQLKVYLIKRANIKVKNY